MFQKGYIYNWNNILKCARFDNHFDFKHTVQVPCTLFERSENASNQRKRVQLL